MAGASTRAVWHGCPQHATKPRTNAAFWRKKFEANKARDLLVNRTLRKAGWRVIRIWEHELERKHLPKALRKLRAAGLDFRTTKNTKDTKRGRTMVGGDKVHFGLLDGQTIGGVTIHSPQTLAEAMPG